MERLKEIYIAGGNSHIELDNNSNGDICSGLYWGELM